MRIRWDGSRWVRLFVLAISAWGLSACALDSPVSTVRIQVPDMSADRSYVLPPLSSPQSRLLNPQALSQITPSGMTPPTTWDQFTCLGIMVTAVDIPEQPLCGPSYKPANPDMPDHPGIFGGLIASSGGEINLKVPSGQKRLVQLIGVMSARAPEACLSMAQVIEESLRGGNQGLMGEPVELARAYVDILSDTTITLKPEFTPETAAQKVVFTCDGTGNQVDPAQFIKGVGGLKMWLSSEMLGASGTDNSLFGDWFDSSNLGNNARQVSPGSQPTLCKTNGCSSGGTLPNGKPVLKFSGSQYLVTGSSLAGDSGMESFGRTVFVAARVQNAYDAGIYGENFSQIHDSGAGLNTGSFANNFLSLGYNLTSNQYFSRIIGSLAGSPISPSADTNAANSAWHVFSLVWRSSNNSLTLFVDGAPKNEVPGALVAGKSLNQLVIGAAGDISFPLHGEIAEVIVYQNEIGNTQRSQIECLLGQKFGISSCPGSSVTGPTDPSSVSGLRLWLKPESLNTYNDGETLLSWPDTSGNGFNATVSPGNAPRVLTTSNLVSNGAGLPGAHRVVHFNGSNYLATSGIPYFNTSNRTVILVGNAQYSAGTDGVLYSEYATSGAGLNSANFLGMLYSSGNYLQSWFFDSTGVWIASSSGSIPSGWHVYSMVWRNLGERFNAYIDGVLAAASSGANTTMAGHGRSVIGANGQLGQMLIGDVAEVIVYDHEIGDGQRQTLECQLKVKYGLPACSP